VAAHVQAASVYVPISHVLEYREFWEDTDNEALLDTQHDETEFPDIYISSLRYLKGERSYYQELRSGKDSLCIDLVKDYAEREDNPLSINLTYKEKYVNGTASGRGFKSENNIFLLSRSRSQGLDWAKLSRDLPNL
jgi:hypothetical protein